MAARLHEARLRSGRLGAQLVLDAWSARLPDPDLRGAIVLRPAFNWNEKRDGRDVCRRRTVGGRAVWLRDLSRPRAGGLEHPLPFSFQEPLAPRLQGAAWVVFGPVVETHVTATEDFMFWGTASGRATVEVRRVLKGATNRKYVQAPWGSSWSDDMSRRGHRPPVGEGYLVWRKGLKVDALPAACAKDVFIGD